MCGGIGGFRALARALASLSLTFTTSRSTPSGASRATANIAAREKNVVISLPARLPVSPRTPPAAPSPLAEPAAPSPEPAHAPPPASWGASLEQMYHQIGEALMGVPFAARLSRTVETADEVSIQVSLEVRAPGG